MWQSRGLHKNHLRCVRQRGFCISGMDFMVILRYNKENTEAGDEMSNRTIYLNNIRARLGSFAYTMKMNSKVNRLGEHISAEDICCDLLNLVFDYELQNANQGKANQIAVDLTDEENHIAAQITTTNTKQKAEHTIAGFRKAELGGTFDILILLIMTGDDLFNGWEKMTCPDAALRILNFVELSKQMEHLPAKKLKAISDYLDEQLGDEMPEPAAQLPSHLLSKVPPATLSFVPGSRDGELAKLIPAVESGQPVYIWGLGGMGKSQMAIHLADRMDVPRGAYFLHYTLPADGKGEAMRETILQANFSGYRFRGTDNENRDAEYRERMDILRNEYAGALLIIDNFDWPGKTLTQLQSEQSFADLTRAGLKLVFTTRYAVEVPEWKIGPISDEDLLALMRQSCAEEDATRDDLLALIRAVDGHTLMVDLMAKTMRRSRGRVTPQTLLQALEECGLDQEDFPDVTSDRNTEPTERQIYAHLKALFDLSGMGEGERAVLRCATLLPEDGMDYNLFRDALPKEQRKLLDRLVDDSWLQCPEKLLLIHPLVREVCRKELEPADEDAREVLHHLWDWLRHNKEITFESYAQITVYYSMASELLPDRSGEWSCSAADLWKNARQYLNALVYDQRYVDRCKKYKLDDDHLSEAYYGLGYTYHMLGRYQLAADSYTEACELRLRMHEEQTQKTAVLYGNLGSVYDQCENHKQALRFKLKACEILEKISGTNPPQLAACYNNIGYTYAKLGIPEKELFYKMKAHLIHQEYLEPDDPRLASSYENLASYYRRAGEPRTALDYYRRGMKIRRDSGRGDHLWLANSYFNLGMAFLDLRNEEQTEVNFRKAIKILEKYPVQDYPTLLQITGTIAEVRKNRHAYFDMPPLAGP